MNLWDSAHFTAVWYMLSGSYTVRQAAEHMLDYCCAMQAFVNPSRHAVGGW